MARYRVLRPHPTRANFMLCDVIGMDARELRDKLADNGILIRHYGTPALRNRVRISVGRPDQNDVLLATLRAIASEAGL